METKAGFRKYGYVVEKDGEYLQENSEDAYGSLGGAWLYTKDDLDDLYVTEGEKVVKVEITLRVVGDS